MLALQVAAALTLAAPLLVPSCGCRWPCPCPHAYAAAHTESAQIDENVESEILNHMRLSGHPHIIQFYEASWR